MTITSVRSMSGSDADLATGFRQRVYYADVQVIYVCGNRCDSEHRPTRDRHVAGVTRQEAAAGIALDVA